MEIKVLEQTKKRMVFEVHGADHTLCNTLKDEMAQDDNVRVATYSIAHPLIRIPRFVVETNGQKESVDVLKAASGRILKINKEFLAGFKKAK